VLYIIILNPIIQANGIKLGPQYQTGGSGSRAGVADAGKAPGGSGCC